MRRCGDSLHVIALALMASMAAAAPASAQDADDPVAAAMRLERARGSKVLITFHDGTRREATFNHLSDTTVTLMGTQGRTVLPLTNVSKIQRIGNYAGRGALLGLLAGFVGGQVWACSVEGESNCALTLGLILGGVGAGAGAVVGRQIDATGARSHLLYSSARKTAIAISPSFTPRTAGATVSMRW